MSVTKIEDYIVKLDRCMPESLCIELINEYGPSNLWEASKIEVGNAEKGVDVYASDDVRKCDRIPISVPEVLQESAKRKELDQRVMTIVSSVFQTYYDKFKYAKCSRDTGYDLLRYDVGGKFTQHVDSTARTPRILTIAFTLNDEFEGGEFAFFDRKLSYRLGVGDCLVFPSSFQYPHEVLPITKGRRYALITWMQ